MRSLSKTSIIKHVLGVLLLSTLLFFFLNASAGTTISPTPLYKPGTISAVAQSLISSLETLIAGIAAASYVAGIAFSIGAIMKFKQHKDNPTQIPVGTPIALLFIAAALIFLPTIITVTGKTLFGEEGIVGGPGGGGSSKIPEKFPQSQ